MKFLLFQIIEKLQNETDVKTLENNLNCTPRGNHRKILEDLRGKYFDKVVDERITISFNQN